MLNLSKMSLWRRKRIEDITPLTPRSYLGRVEQRSTQHISGWIADPGQPLQPPPFEVVIAGPDGDSVVAQGVAHSVGRWVETGENCIAYGFHVVLPDAVTDEESARLAVRPVGGGLQLAVVDPQPKTFHPIRHFAMDIVDNCNLRCPFCLYDYQKTHRTNIMSDEVFDAAIRLIPFVGEGHFWLSCLHEPTMHPKFVSFIERIPFENRANIFYTSNFARRMPAEYYDLLGRSGLGHIRAFPG